MGPSVRDAAILSDQNLSDLTLPIHVSPELLEHLKKLKEQYEYSPRLLLIYQATILVTLLAFSTWHWYSKQLRRHRRHHGINDATGKTDRSNTWWLRRVFHRKRPPLNARQNVSGGLNEDEPLLSPATRIAKVRKIWLIIRSSLMHQPRPLPILNRTMPSNATSVLVVGLLCLNIFFLLFRIDLTTIDGPSIIGDRAGFLFVANLPWLYFLGAKHQPIQMLTGDSYENLNILHRRLGEWLSFLAALHTFGMVMSWYNFLREAGFTLSHFLLIKYILFGILALTCYELLYLTSLASFRAWWYEMFLGCHIILQVAGLVLLFLHHYGGRIYVTAAMIIIVIDRVFLRLAMKTRSFRADLQILEDGHTLLVSADWSLSSKAGQSWMPWNERNVRCGWGPSEHVFLTVPALGRKHTFQAHPFTIASAAPGDGATHAWLNLVIREQAGFSRDLLQFAASNPSTLVRLDGPYGSSHVLDMLRSNDVNVMVIGGSGIAVAYPLLWECLQASQQDSEAATRRRYHLIWIVQDASHLSWIGHERLDELREKGLHVVLPPPTRKCGRPNVPAILQGLVENEAKADFLETRIGVLVSGPDQLNRSVRNKCAEMVRTGWSIDVAVEKYGW